MNNMKMSSMVATFRNAFTTHINTAYTKKVLVFGTAILCKILKGYFSLLRSISLVFIMKKICITAAEAWKRNGTS